MAHREPRIDCRVYLLPEEHEHLKRIAQEQEISLSELIRRTVLKKYPMPKKKHQKSMKTAPKSETVPIVEQLDISKETQSSEHQSCTELSKKDLLCIILQEEKIIHRLITNSTKTILDYE